MIRALCMATAILICLATGASAASGPAAPKVKRIETPKSVLMVGNSFTYYNNGVMFHLVPMLREGDPENAKAYAFKQSTISGAALSEHKLGFEALVKSRKFDAVVLQGNSTEPMVPATEEELQALKRIQGAAAPADPKAAAEEFKEYARRYAKIIRDNGAVPVFFMTWAYTGQPGMTKPLAEAYTAMGNELDALVVPVGLAFERSLKNRPDLAMLISDDRHPTTAGTYLIACTFYAALTGKSPVGLKYDAGLGADTAKYLQGVAWDTTKDYYGR